MVCEDDILLEHRCWIKAHNPKLREKKLFGKISSMASQLCLRCDQELLTWASNTTSREDRLDGNVGEISRSGDNGERNRSTKLISVAVMGTACLAADSTITIRER